MLEAGRELFGVCAGCLTQTDVLDFLALGGLGDDPYVLAAAWRANDLLEQQYHLTSTTR
jgi:hypothetical protein